MGIYLNLIVNPQGITQEAWEAAYEESCLLIEQFPIPLIKFDFEEKYNQKRLVLTKNLFEHKGSNQEHWDWEMSGDLLSGHCAESFRLTRMLNQIEQRQKNRTLQEHRHLL